MEIEVIKKNFDDLRKAKGLKIEEVCAKLGGITRQALYNYMRGGISVKSLSKLADALGVESWQLLKPATEDSTPSETEPGKDYEIICPHCGGKIKISVSVSGNQAGTETNGDRRPGGEGVSGPGQRPG